MDSGALAANEGSHQESTDSLHFTSPQNSLARKLLGSTQNTTQNQLGYTTVYEQPIYTFSQDQEPLDLHKKLYVRLFKRSEKRREVNKR
jgi:hypothetical protein